MEYIVLTLTVARLSNEKYFSTFFYHQGLTHGDLCKTGLFADGIF